MKATTNSVCEIIDATRVTDRESVVMYLRNTIASYERRRAVYRSRIDEAEEQLRRAGDELTDASLALAAIEADERAKGGAR